MSKSSTIIIGGLSGTGSTTAAKTLAERLQIEHVYAGGIFRKLAEAAGETIVQFNQTLKEHPEKEREIDHELIERARQGDVVLESRILGWILPPTDLAFRVWMTCEVDERVNRILKREGTTREKVDRRERLEKERYAELYHVDQDDVSVYDLVIDTTNISADETIDRIYTTYRES